MGLSVSASAAILFVAFLVCFGALFGAVTKYYAAIDDMLEDERDQAIAIQGASMEFAVIDVANRTFTVANVGSQTLFLNDFEVLVDGIMLPAQDFTVSVIGHPGSELMLPGDRATFVLDGAIEGSRIMVFATLGISMTHVPSG